MLDPLTLDQLRVLIAIDDTGSFTAAARKLQRVQSAVSQAVHVLEATLRLPLFDRTGKIPRLTEAGQAVLQEARRVVEGAERLRARVTGIRGGLEPELTLASHQLLPSGPGMRTLRALSETFPDLPVTLLTASPQDAERSLRDGKAHFAIYPFGGDEASDLEAELLMEIGMVPVVSPRHALATHRGTLSRADLTPHTQLVLAEGEISRIYSRGILGERIWRFAEIHAQRGFLLEGFGWGYLPDHFVAEHLASGGLLPIRVRQEETFSIPLHVVHLRSRPPGPAARWGIGRLREILAEGASESPRETYPMQGKGGRRHRATAAGGGGVG